MNEIISISNGNIGGETVQTVNARELHTFLEVGKDFTTWIKDRISQYGFVEGVDYVTSEGLSAPGSGSAKARPQKTVDYHLSLSMGKELSMVERNTQGKKARTYFIACEHKVKSGLPAIPQTYAEALQLAANQAQQLEAQGQVLIEMQPKADFFDAVTDTKVAVDMGIVAKTLNMGVGRNMLFEFLRDKGILDKRNIPYQKYCDAGHFRVVESQYSKPDGTSCISFRPSCFRRGWISSDARTRKGQR